MKRKLSARRLERTAPFNPQPQPSPRTLSKEALTAIHLYLHGTKMDSALTIQDQEEEKMKSVNESPQVRVMKADETTKPCDGGESSSSSSIEKKPADQPSAAGN